MTPAPLLPPHLALQPPPAVPHPAHDPLALPLENKHPVVEPLVRQRMLVGPHGPVADVLREVARKVQNALFGNLRKARVWVGAVLGVSNCRMVGERGTDGSVKGVGRSVESRDQVEHGKNRGGGTYLCDASMQVKVRRRERERGPRGT